MINVRTSEINILKYRVRLHSLAIKNVQVRTVSMIIHERKTQVEGLNVVYLMMSNKHTTKYARTGEFGQKW